MLSNLEVIGLKKKKKIRGQPKLDEVVGRVQFSCQRNFLNPIISKIGQACSPLTYQLYIHSVKALLSTNIEFSLSRKLASRQAV